MTSIVVDGLRYAVAVAGNGPPVLLVHGFTGRGSSWSGLGRALRAAGHRTIAPDLPGHGRSGIADDPCRITVERTADDLAALLDRLGAAPAHVVGYSLGARVALRLAVVHSASVRRLVLESPSAGIADAQERAARHDADERLARRIEKGGIGTFVDEWESQPIFASQATTLTHATLARLRRQRLANRAEGLAASLRGAGQGSMEPLFDRLAAVRSPTLVIAGALDPVGLARARTVAGLIPTARLAVVAGAGHTPHLERPATFRRLVLDLLVAPEAGAVP